MKRSEINAVIREATRRFRKHGWILPPNPRWDVTDFGLRNFRKSGLVLVNLAEEREYCEKIMYVRKNQVTPRHFHAAKKEDIICRWGRLAIELPRRSGAITVQVNGSPRLLPAKQKILVLKSGERITLTRRMLHAFWAASDYAIVGEVSTANDDRHDNYFENKRVGRFSRIVEDEPAIVKLVSD
jgi:hypothetical protein